MSVELEVRTDWSDGEVSDWGAQGGYAPALYAAVEALFNLAPYNPDSGLVIEHVSISLIEGPFDKREYRSIGVLDEPEGLAAINIIDEDD